MGIVECAKSNQLFVPQARTRDEGQFPGWTANALDSVDEGGIVKNKNNN